MEQPADYEDRAAFDLTWAPTRYPSYADEETGSWRLVLEQGTPVAVMWTNEDTGSGVLWLQQTESVKKLHKHFLAGAQNGTPPLAAFHAATAMTDVEFGQEGHGQLSEVTETLDSMMEDDT